MGIISKILSRVNVLVAVYDNTDRYTLSLWRCGMNKRSIDIREAGTAENMSHQKGTPALVLVGGYGVISKSTSGSGDVVGLVTSDSGKFMWNYSDDRERIIFVRNEQLSRLLENTKAKGIKIVSVSCFETRAQDTEAAVAEAAENYFKHTATLRNVCRPGPEGSALGQILFHKLKIPVLGVALLTLTVNAFVSPKIGAWLSTKRQELSALQLSVGRKNESDINRQRLLAEFDIKMPHRFAVACDRIGHSVPDNIILTRMAVQPLTKTVEAGRKPQLSERSVIIKGEAAGPGDVSAFIKSLNDAKKFVGIHLTSIDKDRESGRTLFRIDASL